jgi:hypothetical protein
MITTWFTDFKIMLQFGIPWLIFLSVAYFVLKKGTNNHNKVQESDDLREEGLN